VDWQAAAFNRDVRRHQSGSTLEHRAIPAAAAGLRLQSGKNYTSERLTSKYGATITIDDAVSGAAFFQTNEQSGTMVASIRPCVKICTWSSREKSETQAPVHSRIFKSAGEVDLARRLVLCWARW